MSAFGLARSQLARRVTRLLMALAALLGAWFAWTPGTTFGLSGVLGGWTHAQGHLLDAGLVPVALAAALVGSSVRERRIDEALHLVGLERGRLLTGVIRGAGLVSLTAAAAFAVGCACGGLARSMSAGGSWWADPGAVPGTAAVVTSAARVGLAVALTGALAAMVGLVARRDDVAATVVLVACLPFLEQAAALVGRAPAVRAVLAVTPLGAVRAVALANRGLAAPGFEQPAAVWPYAAVLIGWFAVLVVAVLPADPGGRGLPRAGSAGRRGRDGPTRRRPEAVLGVLALVGATFAFGAYATPSIAAGLPWRWQRSWRDAHRAGWASDETVDEVVAAAAAGLAVDPARLANPGAVPAPVLDAIRRASRSHRQQVATMTQPGLVVVRLEFDEAVRSGDMAFDAYAVRFSLTDDGSGHWRVSGVEGPVAVAGHRVEGGS